MRKEPIRNFIQHAIGGLSKENFDELVGNQIDFYYSGASLKQNDYF